MKRKKKVKVVLFPETQVLDVVGPIAVFEAADRNLPDTLGYDIELIASKLGLVATSGCLSLQAHKTFGDVDLTDVDTILVPGGSKGTPRAMLDVGLRRLITAADQQNIRIASICTGAFILAEAGILEGRQCATHWSEMKKFRNLFPSITLLKNVIYHHEDHIWTSAGVATGIDMALAMVTDDYAKSVSMDAARDLVLYMARKANQNQFSEFVVNQLSSERCLEDLVIGIKTSPSGNYDVARMAEQCNMSVRTFTRKFKDSFGQTPSAMVREIRVAHAELLAKSTRLDQSKIAQLSGFSSVDVMRQAMKSVHRDRRCSTK